MKMYEKLENENVDLKTLAEYITHYMKKAVPSHMQSGRLFFHAYVEGVNPEFTLDIEKETGYITNVYDLDGRFHEHLELPEEKIPVETFLNWFHNTYGGFEFELYHIYNSRGLAQVMSLYETWACITEDKPLSNDDAIGLIGLAQKELGLPITVNGWDIGCSDRYSPFYKLRFGNRTTYTMDISSIIKDRNKENNNA